MKRVSNLAFNRTCGLRELAHGQPVALCLEPDNPFDRDAVAVCIRGRGVPIGWLFKKDNNRAPVLQKLRSGGEIAARIEQDGGKYHVVFWL